MGLLKFWLLEQSFLNRDLSVKFMFSKKATKMDEIFTVDLTVSTYRQIDCEYQYYIFLDAEVSKIVISSLKKDYRIS